MNAWSKYALVAGAASTAVVCAVGYAQEQKDAGSGHGIVRAADLKWSPIMKGRELAAVSGDMNKDGAPFVLRLRGAAGTKIPAHWHPTDENVTVLKGTFQVGMGVDAAGLQTMNPGDAGNIPKEMRHFALSKTATIVQVHGRTIQSELGQSSRRSSARHCQKKNVAPPSWLLSSRGQPGSCVRLDFGSRVKRLPERGASGSVQRGPANPARPGREQRYREHLGCRRSPEVPRSNATPFYGSLTAGGFSSELKTFSARANVRNFVP